jgi:hypothetical protein
MTVIACPKCAQSINFADAVPPMPEGLWFDCPTCMQPFVVYLKHGEISVRQLTRTGVPPRAES